jgi:hypothetical protein
MTEYYDENMTDEEKGEKDTPTRYVRKLVQLPMTAVVYMKVLVRDDASEEEIIETAKERWNSQINPKFGLRGSDDEDDYRVHDMVVVADRTIRAEVCE